MTSCLVDDRYVWQASGQWLDIATGEIVERGHGDSWNRVDDPRNTTTDVRCCQTDGAVSACRTVIDQIVQVADLNGGSGMRTIRVVAPEMPLPIVLSDAARAIRPLGFVAVRAGVDLPASIRRELVHRHVAVFGCDGEWGRVQSDPVTRWIRELAGASTRTHAIVLWQTRDHATASCGASIARERATAFASARPNVTILPDPRLVRAASYVRRGRHAAADRWLHAALGSARRRRNDTTLAHAVCQLVKHQIDRADWDGARVTALRALDDIPDWRPRSEIAALAAQVMIATGDLSRAEAIVQAIAAEAAARDEDLSTVVRVRRAETWFWQGRFEEAATALVGEFGEHSELPLWRGLTRWARGDVAALEDARAQVSASSRLGRAIEAEVLLAAGDSTGARRMLRSPQPGSSGPKKQATLEDTLLHWLDKKCGTDLGAPVARAIDRFIHVSGARGIQRWGIGRTAMKLLHDVSALLQVVQDADDEYAALRRGCSWVREETTADAVGIVGREGTTVIAAAGMVAGDLDDTDLRASIASGTARTVVDGQYAVVTSPMRYGGVTIGFAVLRGHRDTAELLVDAATALASVCASALRARLDALAIEGAGRSLVPEILGRSPAIGALRDAIARSAPTNFPVLVEGESGTGKELVARAVHRLSARRDRRFSALNCAALTDELVEAELFGHTRGAFTGAINARAGLFEESHGSTLFLDEVTELSPRAQAKLLRVLQEREIRRVGEHAPRAVDVRVVAATNLPLAEAVGAGRFREDLLFRLAVVRIRVPPLRDRIEDVPLLAHAFWRGLTAETGKRALLGPDAVAALCRHLWPGNVRELQNVMAGLVVAAPTRGRVGARQVGLVLAGSGSMMSGMASDVSLDSARQDLERRMVTAALARHSGRCASAARELGLSRQGLAKVIKRLGLEDQGRTHKAQGRTDARPDASRLVS